jgi:hypothetical protein
MFPEHRRQATRARMFPEQHGGRLIGGRRARILPE